MPVIKTKVERSSEEFEKNRERYGAEDAIVFRGYDFFEVWALLMLAAIWVVMEWMFWWWVSVA